VIHLFVSEILLIITICYFGHFEFLEKIIIKNFVLFRCCLFKQIFTKSRIVIFDIIFWILFDCIALFFRYLILLVSLLLPLIHLFHELIEFFHSLLFEFFMSMLIFFCNLIERHHFLFIGLLYLIFIFI